MDKLIAVVTGGTRGIGLAIAESLVKRGASLAITYKGEDKDAGKARRHLEGLLKEHQTILTLKGDAGDPDVAADHHRTIRSKLGAVNILVNNAGIMPARSFDEISVQDWDETIRVNLSGAFYWCRQVVPEMKVNRFGRIVNISSIAAREKGDAIHHFCLLSDSIEADVEDLKQRGVAMLDQIPRVGLRGKKIAMTMPSALNGITIELSEP